MNEATVFAQADSIELEIHKPIKIAHLHHKADKDLFRLFDRHLELLRIEKISDEIITTPAGGTFYEYVEPRLEQAQIIVLFLSIDFENDKKYHSPQMINLLKSYAAKGAGSGAL